MNAEYDDRIDACLTRILHYGREMRSRDLTIADQRERAIDDARRMMGLVARYRHILEAMEPCDLTSPRLAA